MTLTSGTDNDTMSLRHQASTSMTPAEIADNENLTLVAGNAGADSGNIGVDGVVRLPVISR